MPPSDIPSKFIHVNDIPFTANGKSDLKSLSTLNETNQSEDVEYIAPNNEIEEIVAEI